MLWGLTRSLPLTTTTIFRKWLPTLLHLITSLCPQTYFLSSFLSSQFLKGINESCLLILQSMSFSWSPTESLGSSKSGVWNQSTAYSGLQRNTNGTGSLVLPKCSPSHMSTHMGRFWLVLFFPFWLGIRRASHLALLLGPFSAWPWVRDIFHEMFLLFRTQKSQGLTSTKSYDSKDIN